MHLVQCCLGNRVVLNAEPLLVGHHQLKYPRQRGGGDLVLQRVVVLLPLDAAGEGALHEALHGLQVRRRARFSCLDLHGHDVAVAKSGGGVELEVTTWGLELSFIDRDDEMRGAHRTKGSPAYFQSHFNTRV